MKKKIKTIKKDFADHFTDPLSLAVWYLDDGTKRKDCDSSRICASGFQEHEVEILQYCLVKNFGLSCNIENWYKSKKTYLGKGFGISFLAKNGQYQKLVDLIKPYVYKYFPSMSYKVEIRVKNKTINRIKKI